MKNNQLSIKWLLLVILTFNFTALSTDVSARMYDEITTTLFRTITPNDDMPHSTTREFQQDKDGYLWKLDEHYLFRYDGYEFEQIAFKADKNTYQLSDFAFDQHNNIWVSSANGGLFKYNLKTQERMHFLKSEIPTKELAINSAYNLLVKAEYLYASTDEGVYKIHSNNHSFILFKFPKEKTVTTAIYNDKHGTLWFGTTDGIYHIKDNKLVKHVFNNRELDQSKILGIIQTKDNLIWINTLLSGVWRFNIKTETLSKLVPHADTQSILGLVEFNDQVWLHTGGNGIEVRETASGEFLYRIVRDSSIENTLSTNQVTELYKDNSNILWVGTRGSKVHYLEDRTQSFRYARPTPLNDKSISFSRIRSIGQLKDNTLLLSSFTNPAIDVIPPNKGKASEIILTANNHGEEQKLIANNFFQDSEDTIWVVAYPAYLVHYNLKTKTAAYFKAPLLKQRYGSILNIMKDPNEEKLWLPMSEGLLSFDLKNKTFTRPDFNFNGPIYIIDADKNGDIWTGNKKGLYWFEYSSKTWHHLSNNDSTNNTFTNNLINSVLIDSKNQLWVGSQFELYKRVAINNQKVTFQKIELNALTEKIELDNLLEDEQGKIWLSRHAFLDPITFETVELSSLSPFDSNSFNTVFLKSQQGELLYAGFDGLNFIDPKSIKLRKEKPKLMIDSVTMDGKTTTLNSRYLPDPANTTNTSIQFTGINLTKSESLTYQYRLVGYDDKWYNTENNSRFINFTALSPDNYTLEVKVTNEMSISTIETLEIEVLPTVIQTFYFKVFITLVIIILIWLFIRWRVRKLALFELQQNNLKLAAEQAENMLKIAAEREKMMEEVLQNKNRMLADVSHELRTPLTALQFEIETLQHDYSENVQDSYQDLRNRINDMNHLINDISDLAKSDTGTLEFNLSTIFIKPFLQKTIIDLKHYALTNGFNWQDEIILKDTTQLTVDQEKIKQLLVNLVNNSIKYTNSGGMISISIKESANSLFMIVNDSAPKVDNKDLQRIFERLYRVESSRSRATGGSGLGLSICKSIVKAHKGSIHAEQSALGGLSIIIEIPLEQIKDGAFNAKNTNC